MKIFEGKTVEDVYCLAIEELLKEKKQINQTYEINNAIFIVHNPSLKFISFPYRKNLSLKYANAELKWYWSADNSCHTIGQYAKMWLDLSDDGKTNNSAYGYILQKKYGFNQIEQVIELLKKDPDTRRAVLNISDPSINRITTKDMQCTIAIDFLIRNNQLEETVIMRSSDVYFGIPYDMIYFLSIGEYIAKRLGLKLGLYTHHSISLHMYLRDVNKFNLETNCTQIINLDVEKIIEENYKYEK